MPTRWSSRRRRHHEGGERRVDLAEIALQLAEPLADRGILGQPAAGRLRRPRPPRRVGAGEGTGRPRAPRADALRGFCFRPSRTIASAGSGPSVARRASAQPVHASSSSGARRAACSKCVAARSARFRPTNARARYRCSLEALDAAADQLLERARRCGVVASIQRQDPVAHAFVGVPELEDLVLRIGARRRRSWTDCR